MPTTWPMTVAMDEPAMPKSSHLMNTMSSARFTALSITTATEASRGLPSTPTKMPSPHMSMYIGAPSNT